MWATLQDRIAQGGRAGQGGGGEKAGTKEEGRGKITAFKRFRKHQQT